MYEFFSPSNALDEFGIGVSLYFRTLKSMFIVLLFCALINLVAIYENMSFNLDQSDVDFYNALVPNNNFGLVPTPDFLLGSVYGAQRNNLYFAKQCAADLAVLHNI